MVVKPFVNDLYRWKICIPFSARVLYALPVFRVYVYVVRYRVVIVVWEKSHGFSESGRTFSWNENKKHEKSYPYRRRQWERKNSINMSLRKRNFEIGEWGRGNFYVFFGFFLLLVPRPFIAERKIRGRETSCETFVPPTNRLEIFDKTHLIRNTFKNIYIYRRPVRTDFVESHERRSIEAIWTYY